MASGHVGRLAETLKVAGFWDNLSPNQRRGAVVISGIAGLLLLMSVMTSNDEGSPRHLRDNVKRNVLTDTNTRAIGIDALNAKVRTVESDNERLQKDLSRLMSELQEVKRRRGNDPDVTRQLSTLQGQLKHLTHKAQALGWDVDDIKGGYYTAEADTTADALKGATPVEVVDKLSEPQPAAQPIERPRPVQARVDEVTDPRDYFRAPPVRPTPVSGSVVQQGDPPVGTLTIYTAESVAQTATEPDASTQRYLPAGSIITGVLLNGLDAATGRGARNDPYPVLVRVQKEAILPNFYRADVTECFATLAGYGELSAERAFLRGETFSCVTENGDVIEQKFPGYAVGEDGKAGIRGRLVTKTGSLLAKAALAGVSAGIAAAFNTSPVPVIQTSEVSSDKVYQDNFSSQALQHGVSTGASSALNRLADYYMDMADQIFPVIEIDAGRQIDIVLTTGFTLSIKEG